MDLRVFVNGVAIINDARGHLPSQRSSLNALFLITLPTKCILQLAFYS